MIRLTAARKHEQRYNAASTIQSEWRAHATRNSFVEMKAKTIQIQSVVRMFLATRGLKDKKSKIVEAADYHKDDYFAYSKKRKAAAVMIQAVYRMHPIRKEYLAKKMQRERLAACNKIQSAYRRRYFARMSRAGSKTDLTTPRPIFDDLNSEQHPIQHHTQDLFASAKKRRVASTSIQAAFRGHLGRQSAKKTAYLAKHAFELSKQRRVAADKIQNAYRRHLFRTTCHLKPVERGELCTEIVPFVAPTDGGFEIVVAGTTDLLTMLMAMITG